MDEKQEGHSLKEKQGHSCREMAMCVVMINHHEERYIEARSKALLP